MSEFRTPLGALLVSGLLAVPAFWLLPPSIVAVTALQQNRSHKFGPGECGPVDPSYIQLANETGGHPFFLNPSEVAKAFHFVRETSGTGGETLLWATGAFDSDAVQEFAVPVDSTTRRVTFSLSVQTSGSDLTVIDPAGGTIAVADHRTEITVLNCGRIVTIDAPAAGVWRLCVGGVGRFWLTAHAKTEIAFITAEFVRPGGRPGHEGLFRIDGQPLAGAPATLRAVLGHDAAASASFDLVSLHGDAIASLTGLSDNDAEFVAAFQVPPEPFRIRARGVDQAGLRFQRVFHTLFHGATVEVTPPATDAGDEIVAGTSAAFPFRIRNAGPAATFRIMAADGRRFISRFDPRSLALDAGATGLVTVWVSIPPDTPPGTNFDITVTASSESGSPTTNGASRHLSVSAR